MKINNYFKALFLLYAVFGLLTGFRLIGVYYRLAETILLTLNIILFVGSILSDFQAGLLRKEKFVNIVVFLLLNFVLACAISFVALFFSGSYG